MHLSITHFALLFLAAFVAGTVNSIAGGGTLISFPALIFAGVPALVANATNTMALVPGSISAFQQYRAETGNAGRYWLWLGVPSLIGAIVGAMIAVHVGDKAFELLVPWLVLAATVLFILQEPIRRAMFNRSQEDLTETSSIATLSGVMIFQFIVAVYGGFFGAGIGILMLASLGFLGIKSIHKVNGLKNLSAVFINGAAAVTFAFKHQIDWNIALMMAVGAVIGGYVGATVAQRMPEKAVKATIIVIGIVIALAIFYKQWRAG